MTTKNTRLEMIADFQTVGSVRDTQQRPADSRQQIDHRGLPTAKQALGKPSQAPKTPHVESKMKKTSVDEARSHQTPILTIDCQRAKVSAPPDQLLSAESHERTQPTLQDHHHINSNVDGQQSSGYQKASHGRGATACSSGGRSRTRVAQYRSDTLFVDREFGTAFEAARHGDRIASNWELGTALGLRRRFGVIYFAGGRESASLVSCTDSACLPSDVKISARSWWVLGSFESRLMDFRAAASASGRAWVPLSAIA